MATDLDIFIGILLAIIAYAALYLGKGLQKYAIVGFTKEGATRGEKGKHSGIWIAGLVLTGAFLFIHLFALKFAAISIIAPFEGLGLVILCLFSHFILKESIDRIKSVGISLILIGLILTAIFIPSPEEAPPFFDWVLFLILFCVIMSIFTIAGLFSKFNKYKAAGVIFGSFAGAFMCFQTLAKRVTWLPGYSYFLFITFAFAAATLLMTNFGFLKAKAVVIVPCFTAMSIMLPTILAIFLFNEPVVLLQWIGIIIIVVGVIFLTAFSKEEESASKQENLS
ncbi:MAG TPA: DMT family transporter [Candidatus Deferrimicrobium sp.]|nr:DMT family transporter [Candidatus Deferrimicrobium sp.]